MLGASMILTRAHRPFKVIRETDRFTGRKTGSDFHGLKTLIINNAQVMSADEVERVRSFVHAGGTLIATGLTSWLRPDGTTSGDFALAHVFGVSHTGQMSKRVNFLAGEKGYTLCNRPAPLVRLAGAQQLLGLAEPLFDPDDPQKYASIHSNPPGRLTGAVGLSVHSYGKGRCIYLAPALLTMQQDAQQSFGARLLEEYAPPALVTGTNAPAAVEMTVLRSTTAAAFLVGVVNYQKELPNIPVHDLWVDLRLPGRAPRACQRVADGKALPFRFEDGVLHVDVPELETIEMVEILT
jgi:hypothetical protein